MLITLSAYKNQVNEYIQKYLQSQKSLFKCSHHISRQVFTTIASSATKGKCIRGSLVLHLSSLFNYKSIHTIIPIAAALELIHFGLLVQDDVMDNDLLRRGKPTVFATYQNTLGQVGTKDLRWLSGSLAHLTGSLCFFLANKMLCEANFSSDLKIQMLRVFQKEIAQIEIAQMDDLIYGKTASEPNQNIIENIYRYKTGRYSFSLPFVLTALITKQSPELISDLEKIGEPLGILFQIKDDELSINGNTKETGKSIGSDIIENKKTLIRHILFTTADEITKKRLHSFFGSSSLSSQDLQFIKTYMISTPVQSKLDKIIKKHEKKLISLLKKSVLPISIGTFINDLQTYVLSRKT
ncbi:polyprenyl synthetase family protein [Patescibacteria group bacterium]|nr:polyprenyl synthetase family protein [Patescibacteria group bacterium]